MAAVPKLTTFAEQRAFAAQVAKEKAAAEWAMQQSTEEQREQEQPRRRVRQRRTTRDGKDIFAVTFFDGDKPKRIDWLAKDAKMEGDFGVEHHPKGSLGHRLRQIDRGGGGLSKSRSEPCLRTHKRERKKQHHHHEESSRNLLPFRTFFPLPPKGIEMRKETARDESELFKPRPETVALSATEKYEMRKWGIDVDAILWPDGTSPPAWLKAVGNTTNKWANREMAITAAREEQEYVEKLRETSRNQKKPSSIAQLQPARDSYSSSRQPPSSSTTTTTPPPPPWVKELPPVRDGRRQFATGVIIPFLDQHVYPPGGVAEVKRARRREKEAFLKNVFVTTSNVSNATNATYVNANANNSAAAPRKPAGVDVGVGVGAGAGAGGVDAGGACCSGGPGGNPVDQATRGLPLGGRTGVTGGNGTAAAVVVAAERRRREQRGSGSRRKSGGGGGGGGGRRGSCRGGGSRAAATNGGGAGAAADGAAPGPSSDDAGASGAENSSSPAAAAKAISAPTTKAEEDDEPPLLPADGGADGGNAVGSSSSSSSSIISSSSRGTGSGSAAAAAIAEGSSDLAQLHRDKHAEEVSASSSSGKRGRDSGGREKYSGRVGENIVAPTVAARSEERDYSPKEIQRRGGGQGGSSGGGATGADLKEKGESTTAAETAAPAPVVTSSISVLDMGVVGPSE